MSSIECYVSGQSLRVSHQLIVADTINYLEAECHFKTQDWNGLAKWVHFAKDGAVYDLLLHDDKIDKDSHLNLSDGVWSVYLHGNDIVDGVVTERITTEVKTITVKKTGILNGEPLPDVPPSVAEQVGSTAAQALAIADQLRQDADNGIFDGKSAYELAVSQGFKGTIEEWLQSLDYEHSEEFTQLAGQVRRDAESSNLAANNAGQSEKDAFSSAAEAARMVSTAEKNLENTIQAVREAKTSAQNAAKSEKEASTSAYKTEQAVLHPPIIKGDLWWVWDFSSEQYTSTGVSAKGDPGKTPVKGIDYFTQADKEEIIQEIKKSLI